MPGAMRRLTDDDWPGNVRELENVIERELILSRGRVMTFQSVIQQSDGVNIPYDGTEECHLIGCLSGDNDLSDEPGVSGFVRACWLVMQ